MISPRLHRAARCRGPRFTAPSGFPALAADCGGVLLPSRPRVRLPGDFPAAHVTLGVPVA